MEADEEGRVKVLAFKVRAASRESQAQRAVQVLDSDLRSHWSTSTNTKEWLLLELEEACLLSQIRIHNKSVLEWEISIGLRFKPDTFVKVRPRCEAPRREMTYHIGHQPCRFVRISCLRGNPIAIFFVQLLGIPVPGLEPELQPVVDHLLPQIVSHIRDPHDIYLQLLQEISLRVSPFLQHLEVCSGRSWILSPDMPAVEKGELSVPSEAMESTVRFLAMLVGPFYPFLAVFGGFRDSEKTAAIGGPDLESGKSSLASVFTVSSNFQAPPRRVRSPGLSLQPAGHALALRPDAVVLLLKVAYKDNSLGSACRKVARLLRKLGGPSLEGPSTASEMAGLVGEDSASVNETSAMPSDYSSIFGEGLRVLDDESLEIGPASMVDIPLVEEGLLHVLYACATQPTICRRLADAKSDLSPVLPFLQALLPALRPPLSTSANTDHVDETFGQWQAPLVQRALTQVVALATAPSYRPLLDACVGYLSSYSPAHEKAACVLIDLCVGPLALWLSMIIAKVDLAIELLEDLLGIIQAGHQAPIQARAVLVYMMLALSGHVDDVLLQYKKVKHQVLFVIEMLEPYLIPAIMPVKSAIAFGDVSAVVLEKQEQTCALALDLLHTALQKPAVLPAMEAEWRRGHVAPSVLLSILAPHVALPPGIDLRKTGTGKGGAAEASDFLDALAVTKLGVDDEETTTKLDVAADGGSKVDSREDGSLFFAPLELKGLTLPCLAGQSEGTLVEDHSFMNVVANLEGRRGKVLMLDVGRDELDWNLQVEHWQLVNMPERELRASEFIRFAAELHSRQDARRESREAAIDALLLAAECHLNPFFMISSSEYQHLFKTVEGALSVRTKLNGVEGDAATDDSSGLKMVAWLEEERDKAVLSILLQAAEWDSKGPLGGGVEGKEYQDSDGCLYGIEVDAKDSQDAVTLVRQHQSLLCQFLVRQSQRERQNLYEVVLQGLLFVLDSATQLSSPAEDIIDVILVCAARLNASLIAHHNQANEGSSLHGSGTLHGIRQQWILLRRLVLAASGGRVMEDDIDVGFPKGSFLQRDLIPVWAWISKIPQFSSSCSPLVRYVGWMALARCAQFHFDTELPFLSDMQHLTALLLIFSDELVSVELLKYREPKEHDVLTKAVVGEGFLYGAEQDEPADPGDLVRALYPEFNLVLPRLRAQFSQFAETLLNAICSQIQGVPYTAVPDMLSWLSEICYQPFPHIATDQGDRGEVTVKGFALGNLRYVVMRLLEVMVVEHMEAIMPELPRVLQVLMSLCGSSYCDVPLLDAVLKALKPIISHATARAATTAGDFTFEALCFDTMMKQLNTGPETSEQVAKGGPKGALLLFLCGSLLSDLSMSRRNKLLNSLMAWVKFTDSSSTSSWYDYLCAFQRILEETHILLQGMVGESKVPDLKEQCTEPPQALFALTDPASLPMLGTPESEESDTEHPGVSNAVGLVSVEDEKDGSHDDSGAPESASDVLEFHVTGKGHADQIATALGCSAEKEEFRGGVRLLVLDLGPALETAWKVHPQLTSRITQVASQCLRCCGVKDKDAVDSLCGATKNPVAEDRFLAVPVEALAQAILRLQQARCWQVAHVMMDYLLGLPSVSFHTWKHVYEILQYQCSHAPRVAWRLRTTQWLAKAVVMESLSGVPSDPLIQLLSTMLEHPEPEQRAEALKQLAILVDNQMSPHAEANGIYVGEYQGFLQMLVADTWVKVVSSATTEVSAGLRRQALKVVLKMVPLAQPFQLQSLLRSIDAVLTTAPLTKLGLVLLARVCLYSAPSDLEIIPAQVWSSVQHLAESKPGGRFVEEERATCQALLQMREHGEDAKKHMWEVLLSTPEKLQPSASFIPVREAVLEVLARLNVMRSKADVLTAAALQEAKELEEAEIEMELVREEQAAGLGGHEALLASSTAASASGVYPVRQQFKQLRDRILAEEKLGARAEVAARRERQRVARRDRQLALQEATLREMELLQELDRERAAEAEREVERQRMLEKERAKTRELRHSLDLEAEKRAQREFQKELEQRETGGLRPSRREFTSSMTPSSRPRERYRERDREFQRSSQEGPSRPTSDGGGVREGGITPPATPTATATAAVPSSAIVMPTMAAPASSPLVSGNPAVVSSRVYAGQALTFTHTGDGSDERGYEGADGNGTMRETVDGSSSFGDLDGGLSMDAGNSSNLSSNHRQGPRASRPRQIV